MNKEEIWEEINGLCEEDIAWINENCGALLSDMEREKGGRS